MRRYSKELTLVIAKNLHHIGSLVIVKALSRYIGVARQKDPSRHDVTVRLVADCVSLSLKQYVLTCHQL